MTIAPSRPNGASPLDDVARRHPEWHAWLALYREAREAAADPAWSAAVATATANPSREAPAIAGAAFTVESGRMRRLLRALLSRAFTVSPKAIDDAKALQILEAAVNDDRDALAAHAAALHLGVELFAETAALAAMPLLQACRQAWAAQVPSQWQAAACPICGAWATLTEARGLERSLCLRCGRCGADWPTAPVRCAFCATADHERLGALVAERAADTRKVDTCSECLGYMKSVTTLQACAPEDVRLLDLDTVELDVAALEHGYARPARPAHDLKVRIAGHPGWALGGLFGRGR
jgi:FdhE protein